MNQACWVIRRDADRGRYTHEWLDARFSFSFGDWHDPDWPSFGPLTHPSNGLMQAALSQPGDHP